MRREPAFDKILYDVPKKKEVILNNGYTKVWLLHSNHNRYQDTVITRMTYETFPEGFWYSLFHLFWLMNWEFLFFTKVSKTAEVYRAMIGKSPRMFKRACREEQTAKEFSDQGMGYGSNGQVCHFEP